MAPANPNAPAFAKDERVLCFHGELLYEAKILDNKFTDANDKKSPILYQVHYKGWKASWDDWVNADRIRKFTDENKELAQTLKKTLDASLRKPVPVKTPAKRKAGSDGGSLRDSEERHSSLPATGRGQKRRGDNDIEKEEAFAQRPLVNIPVSDLIRGYLVDDWEYITKDLKLLVLPSEKPVNMILDEYYEDEKTRRRIGSPEMDLLEEVRSGLKSYFRVALGRILLYTYERKQYQTMRREYADNEEDPAWVGKDIGDVYGVEHLCRLIVTMPELLAHSNTDAYSVGRAREELIKLGQWITRNYNSLFIMPYEFPGQPYVDVATAT